MNEKSHSEILRAQDDIFNVMSRRHHALFQIVSAPLGFVPTDMQEAPVYFGQEIIDYIVRGIEGIRGHVSAAKFRLFTTNSPTTLKYSLQKLEETAKINQFSSEVFDAVEADRRRVSSAQP